MQKVYNNWQQDKTQIATCLSHFTLTATCCIVSQVQAWLPVAVDNHRKAAQSRTSDLIPSYIRPSKSACLHHPSALWWQTVEGYRVMSLSSRSLEEMRRRCMVRLMFNRWLLPHTQPSESARQHTHTHTWVYTHYYKMERVARQYIIPLK